MGKTLRRNKRISEGSGPGSASPARCTGAHCRAALGLAALGLALTNLVSTAGHALEVIQCDTGVPSATMRLFDAHDHFRIANVAEGEADLAELAGFGISLGVVALSTPDPNDFTVALDLQTSSSTPVFAFAMPLPVTGSGGEKTYDSSTLTDLQNQLGQGASGIGELLLRHSGPETLAADIPADQATAMEIYTLAGTLGLPVLFHFETRDKSAPGVDVASRIAELDAAVSAHPGTTFIWAHLGDTGPATVRTRIEAHDNLYADLSTRNPDFVRGWPATLQSLGSGSDGRGSLKPEWSQLFEDHPTRFLLGFDLANQARRNQLLEVVGFYRSILGELSQSTAERIACKNAQALLSTNELPGPRLPWLLIGALGVLALGGAAGSARLKQKHRT